MTLPLRTARRPAATDFAEYYTPYVALVPDGDVVEHLAAQRERFGSLLASVPAERAGHRYAEGKWTIEELVGHVVDIERVFSYRVMCFCRGMGEVPQAGVDQDVMVAASGATARGLASLAEEFDHLRAANLVFLRSLSDADLDRRGVASGVEFSALAVAFTMYGHLEHHANVLSERYI